MHSERQNKRQKTRTTFVVGVIATTCLVLSGCSGLRNALGISKRPPDEFEVVKKAPLVVPPEYNLRPPRPGAARPQELSSRAMAIEALFPERVTSLPQRSPGEEALLKKIGATSTDTEIRQKIADEETIVANRGVFAGDILFTEEGPVIGGVTIEREISEPIPESDPEFE